MPTVVVRHKVGDFETWLKGHEDRVRLFAPAVSSFKTFQDQDDPKSVVMVLEVTDMEKLGAIMNDPNIQEAKDRHTVKGSYHSFNVGSCVTAFHLLYKLKHSCKICTVYANQLLKSSKRFRSFYKK